MEGRHAVEWAFAERPLLINRYQIKGRLVERIQVKDKEFVPYLSAERIAARVTSVGRDLARDYAGREPVFIVVLNGAFMWASDVIKSARVAGEVAFVRVASYAGMASTGQVEMLLDVTIPLKGRDVIVVEDIVDTGRTIVALERHLAQYEPASVAVLTLLHKPEATVEKVNLAYVGFEIENKFVVGYGLDYDGAGRHLDAIYQLAPES